MIPQDYLSRSPHFMVMRMCHGIGDWGIISAMPRLLKTKYPNTMVFAPSPELIDSSFGSSLSQWSNGKYNSYNIFQHNPYVDDFVDSFPQPVFHDHFRVTDPQKPNTPLIKEMLRFWRFKDSEIHDCRPEIYFSQEEIKQGDKIISQTLGLNNKFGCLLLSNRFGTLKCGKFDQDQYNRDTKNISKVLQKYKNLTFFYWSSKELESYDIIFPDNLIAFGDISIRLQLYIKTKALVNISNQCGMNHIAAKYSTCYESQRQFPLKSNTNYL